MDKKVFRGLLLTLAVMGLLWAPAAAQVKAVAEMTCAFNVEDTLYPPGAYNLLQITKDQYVLESPTLKVTSIFMTSPKGLPKGSPAKDFELVFKIYGDRYFLSALRVLGDTDEHDLIPHSVERELMAKGAPRTEVVRCLMAPGPK